MKKFILFLFVLCGYSKANAQSANGCVSCSFVTIYDSKGTKCQIMICAGSSGNGPTDSNCLQRADSIIQAYAAIYSLFNVCGGSGGSGSKVGGAYGR